MTSTLRPAIAAPQHEIHCAGGRMTYFAKGAGEPLLLLHSINAAASAYEVQPLFDRLTADYRVYAPDLPGFGLSDRTDQTYSVKLYVDSIRQLIDEILDRENCKSCHVLALSLTSEFAARIAREDPDMIRSLTLVTPTGFNRGSNRMRKPEGTTREIGFLSALTKRPAIGRFLFRLLSRPRVIRFFLKKTFGNENYDEGLARYDEETTRQDGAQFAPLAFVSGRLFSSDIRDVYEALNMPVFLAHGTKGDFDDFSESEWTTARDNWSREAYPTGAFPHFEVPDHFLKDYRRFLETER